MQQYFISLKRCSKECSGEIREQTKDKRAKKNIDEEYFEDETSEVNTVGIESAFLSEDNGVKLAKKEKTEEYLGGNSKSDIFRY